MMSFADDGDDCCDLGLGFGLKPGSLMSPVDLLNGNNCELNNKFNFIEPADTSSIASTGETLEESNYHLNNNRKSNGKKGSFAAEDEVELLKYELDSVKKQLTSKRQAIKILQQQLKFASSENEHLENKLKWMHKTLIKDFNCLQFSVERERQVTTESREFLQAKIERLETENMQLKLVVDVQKVEIKSRNNLAKKRLSCYQMHGDHPVCSPVDLLQNEFHKPVECECLCLEYRKCSCAKYADSLVRMVRDLNKELENLKSCSNCHFLPAEILKSHVSYAQLNPETNGYHALSKEAKSNKDNELNFNKLLHRRRVEKFTRTLSGK